LETVGSIAFRNDESTSMHFGGMSPKLLTEIVSPVLSEVALPPAVVELEPEPEAAVLEVLSPDVLMEAPPPELPHATSSVSAPIRTIFFM
jgi:hypothetical protein